MIRLIAVAVLFWCFGLSSAHAGLISIDWSGAVSSAPGALPFGNGESISGVFVYDDSSTVDSVNGLEVVYATDHSTMFSVGGFNVVGSGGTIEHDTTPVCLPFPPTCVGAEELILNSNTFSGDFLGGFAVDQFSFSMGWVGGGGTSGSPLPSQINREPLVTSGETILQGGGESIRLDIGDITFTEVEDVPIPATG